MAVLKAKQIVGSDLLVTETDGLRLYDAVSQQLTAGEPVVADFAGVNVVNTAFLDAWIGKLYMKYGEKPVNTLLTVKNIPKDCVRDYIVAARVAIFYRKEQEARGMDCNEVVGIDLVPVESSNLKAVGYDPATGTLYVSFRSGHLYRYEGVPLKVYQDLLTGDSPGAYFAGLIRNKYQTQFITMIDQEVAV